MKGDKWTIFGKYVRITFTGGGIGCVLYYIGLVPVMLVNPDAHIPPWTIFIGFAIGMLIVNALYDSLWD